MRHNPLWMIAGCLLPLLIIFFAPLLGIQGNVSILVFFLVMFACHFFMIGGHGNRHDEHSSHQNKNPK